MAMSLPVLIAVALGGGAAAYGAGQLRQQQQEKHEGQMFAQKMLQEGIMKNVFSGDDVPFEAFKQAVGNQKAQQLWPLMQTFIQAQRSRREANMAQGAALMGSMFGQGQGEVPDYFGRGGVVPLSPEQQAAFGGGGGAAPSALGPATSQLAQAGAPSAAPSVAPPAEAAPEPAAPAPSVGPRPAPVRRTSVSPPLGGGSVHFNPQTGEYNFTRTMPSAEERLKARGAEIRAQARPGDVSPRELIDIGAQHGVTFSKDQLDQYGFQDWSLQRDAYVKRAMGTTKVVTPEVERQAARAYMYERGWAPDAATQGLFMSQGEANAKFLDLLNYPEFRDQPVARIVAKANQVGLHPDDVTVKQMVAQQRSLVETRLMTTRPDLRANPAAMLREIALQVGPEALSDAERTQMRALAPIGQATTEEMVRGNQVPPLMADVGTSVVSPPPTQAGAPGMAGVAPGAPPRMTPTQAYEQAKAKEAAQAGRVTQSQTVGTAAGKEIARPQAVVDDPVKLQRYIDPKTLRSPDPQEQGQLDKAVKDRKLYIVKDRQDVEALAQLEGYIKRYRQNIDTLKPIFKSGGASAFVKSLPITGVNEPFMGIPIVPGGMLSAGMQRWWVRNLIESGISDEKADKIVGAMVDMNNLYNDAPLVFRQLGQRGNVPGHLVTRETRSLPTITENEVTVEQKLKGLTSMVDKLWEGIGLPAPVRNARGESDRTTVRVTGPDGKAYNWDMSHGPIPNGYRPQ